MSRSMVDVKGIGPATVVALSEHGFNTVRDIANASIDRIALVPGFSVARATMVRSEAKALLESGTPSKNAETGKDKGPKEKKAKSGGKKKAGKAKKSESKSAKTKKKSASKKKDAGSDKSKKDKKGKKGKKRKR